MPDPALYTVGLITAITTEFAATCAMLDSEEEEGPDYVSPGDTNSYTLGTMGKHNVVIAGLPHGDYGTNSAAAAASNMLNSFPNIRIGLMVGIGGGAPTEKHDIRLGDIVVSARDGDSSAGSVFQYDFGKTIQNQEFKTTRLLNQPPPALLTALSNLRQFYDRKGGHTLENDVESAFAGSPGIQGTHSRPESTTDWLYKSDYVHNSSCCAGFGGDNDPNLVVRAPRKHGKGKSVIHYGVIASSNQLMKDARMRDKMAKEHGVLCFEMEAAGLMNHFPCLVVRGICDYSDSHKNKRWQGYAAMMAAAYTKSLLKRIAPTRIEQERKLSEIVTGVEGSVKGIHTSINNARIEHRDDKIHNWLSHPDLDPSVNYNKAREERIKDSNSGHWFLRNETFARWKLRKNSSLWLYGITGCGKTVLISTVLEYLERTYENVLYFYFDFAQERKQSVDGMISCLISQLTGKSKASRRHADSLYTSHQQGNVQPNLRSLCETFQAMVNESGEVWIILDALDECKMRQDRNGYPGYGLLSWIKSLVSHEMANVHLIFTSRPEQDIKSTLDKWMDKENMFSVESGFMNGDIQEYVHTKVREHEGLERWHSQPYIQKEIENALLKKANGMFRWVSCQIQSLEQCLELSTLWDTLETLPTTLEETYARVLNNLPEATKHLTIRILQFLTYSERPLGIEEAIDMVITRTNPQQRDFWFKAKFRLPLPGEIARYCSSLVNVTIRNDFQAGDRITGSIQLAHFSVKEYLVSKRLELTIRNDFQEIIARTQITEVCLAYLLALPDDIPFREIKKQFPFARFAAKYWAMHATFVEEQTNTTLFFVREYLSRDPSYKSCHRLYDPQYGWSSDNPDYFRSMPPLYYAVLNRLPCSVQMLLDQGADVNEKGQMLSSPLTCAVQHGYKEIVRILITSSADVNADDGSALFSAVEHGYEEIVRILMTSTEEINVDIGLALLSAAENKHEEIFKILMDEETLASSRSLAFLNAAGNGHDAIVEMLIRPGTEIGPRGSALVSAARNGNDAVIKILMRSGTDVDSRSSALIEAAKIGHVWIVRILIQAGVHVGSRSSALVNAASNGHVMIVKTLVDAGVLVGSRLSALTQAASNGYDEIVEFLVNSEAYTKLDMSSRSLALVNAATNGHKGIVEILLSTKADVEVDMSSRGLVLLNAVRNRWGKIIKILIHAGVDVASRNSALLASVSVGNKAAVRMLLASGADVNSRETYENDPSSKRCSRGLSALQLALSYRFTEIIILLISRGADVNNEDGTGELPLQKAVSWGDEEIVWNLIQAGADANKQAEGHKSTLDLVCRKQNKRIHQMLFGSGFPRIVPMSVKRKFEDLCIASQSGQKDVVEHHLDSRVPTAIDGTHNCPLYFAAIGGHYDIVELLLDREAYIDAHSEASGPVLAVFSDNGNEKMVKTLLTKGADVNANSGLAIHHAARKGHDSIVQTLLNHGADVNLERHMCGTPLVSACKGGHAIIVEMLLMKGANVNANSGLALYTAASKGFDQVFQLLLDYGANFDLIKDTSDELLVSACKSGHVKIIQILLMEGADPGILSQYGPEAFCAACAVGSLENCSILLELGVHVAGLEEKALYAATKGGHAEVVQFLLDLGCDVDSEYEGHDRPLLVACAGGHVAVVSTLLQCGAKVNGNFDESVFVAAKRGYREIVQMLRRAYRERGHGERRNQTGDTC